MQLGRQFQQNALLKNAWKKLLPESSITAEEGKEGTELVVQNIIELAIKGGLEVSEEDIKELCCSHMAKS